MQQLFINPEQFKAVDTNQLLYAMATDGLRMIALHKDNSKGGGRDLKRSDTSSKFTSISSGGYNFPSINGRIEGSYEAGWYHGGSMGNGTPSADLQFYNDFNSRNFSLTTYDEIKDLLPAF